MTKLQLFLVGEGLLTLTYLIFLKSFDGTFLFLTIFWLWLVTTDKGDDPKDNDPKDNDPKDNDHKDNDPKGDDPNY